MLVPERGGWGSRNTSSREVGRKKENTNAWDGEWCDDVNFKQFSLDNPGICYYKVGCQERSEVQALVDLRIEKI